MSTDAPRAWFHVSAGLLTWEHHKRLGPAWTVFLYLVHQQRRPRAGETDNGICRNGQPITYAQIGKELHGMPARTVEKHITVLEREKYIRTEYVRGQGKRYWISNPLRWSVLGLPKIGESIVLDSPDPGSASPQTCGVVPPNLRGSALKLGECNKEARILTTRRTEPRPIPPAGTRTLPAWLPLDSWEGFVEMRRKIRAPLTEKAIDLTLTKLAKFRGAGQDIRQVLDESVQNSWRGVWPLKGSYGSLNKAEQRQADNLRAAEQVKRELGLVS